MFEADWARRRVRTLKRLESVGYLPPSPGVFRRPSGWRVRWDSFTPSSMSRRIFDDRRADSSGLRRRGIFGEDPGKGGSDIWFHSSRLAGGQPNDRSRVNCGDSCTAKTTANSRVARVESDDAPRHAGAHARLEQRLTAAGLSALAFARKLRLRVR